MFYFSGHFDLSLIAQCLFNFIVFLLSVSKEKYFRQHNHWASNCCARLHVYVYKFEIKKKCQITSGMAR